MNFKDFILQSPNYKGLYILEENGNEKIIIGKNNQFGNKTDKTIMIYIEGYFVSGVFAMIMLKASYPDALSSWFLSNDIK